MNIITSVSSEEFTNAYEEGKLGKLYATVPLAKQDEQWRSQFSVPFVTKSGKERWRGEFQVDLKRLFSAATGFDGSKYGTIAPKDIEAICLTGSVLHNHVPFKEEDVEHKRPKYFLFGPEIVTGREHIIHIKDMLDDIDVVVITKDSLDGRANIVPTKKISPKMEKRESSYGPYDFLIPDGVTAVYHSIYCNGYDLLCQDKKDWPVSLHIDYRSADQIKNGIGKGDTVSESLIHHGVPIIGKASFARMVAATDYDRAPLHDVILKRTGRGKINAYLE